MIDDKAIRALLAEMKVTPCSDRADDLREDIGQTVDWFRRRLGIGAGRLSLERDVGRSCRFWICGGDTEIPIDA